MDAVRGLAEECGSLLNAGDYCKQDGLRRSSALVPSAYNTCCLACAVSLWEASDSSLDLLSFLCYEENRRIFLAPHVLAPTGLFILFGCIYYFYFGTSVSVITVFRLLEDFWRLLTA